MRWSAFWFNRTRDDEANDDNGDNNYGFKTYNTPLLTTN